MKRLTAIVIALVMALAVLPALGFADGVHSVTYSGTELNFVGKELGSTSFYYLDVSEGSAMFSGHWLIDYPEEIVTITNNSVTWNGGVAAQVAATWDDEEAWSDKPAFVCNPEYEGQTGGKPVGEAGNIYANCGMYLTSGEYGGLLMGGHMIRLTMRYDRVPYFSECSQDENGWYVEVPTVVLESTYFITTSSYATHEEIISVPGKLYCTPQEDPFFGGTLTVNYVYEDGTEAAPSIVQEYEQGVEYSIESPFIVQYDPDIAVVEGVMPNEDVTVTVTYSPKTNYSVTYTGATVDATDKAVGDTFHWTLGVSEYSYMFSGHWLVDYPEEYLTPTGCTVTWTGGLTYLVNQTWDDEEAWSDKPAFVCNMIYEGQTGGKPIGEAGNMYSNIGMYLTSADFYGLQMGGNMVRLTFTVNELPPANCVEQDENGYYIEIPVEVFESTCFVAMQPNETGAGYIPVYKPHDEIIVVPGKVYVTPAEPVYGYTVTFYGLDNAVLGTETVLEGEAATAPEAPEVVDNENGTWIFCGWDVEFDNITADTEVHAVYYLLGDTNLDGNVTANDALLSMRYALGLIDLNDVQLKVSDVDFSNDVTANDALKVMRYALNLIPSLVD